MADPYGLIFDGAPELGAREQAAETYAKLPATFGERFGAITPAMGQNLTAAINAGMYEDSIWGRTTRAALAAGLGEGMAEGAPSPVDQELLTPAEPLADKQQRPAEVVNKLAGAHITDIPMGVHLSDILIEAKQKEIERQRINERFENAHSWPVNFGTELAAGLLDPVNAATAFVPGLGEEALLARLGSGLFGRVAARAAAQAAGTEVAQLPIEVMRYGLAREESADFDLRSAFSDLAMGAAYGAVAGAGHALLGAGWNALKGRVQARTGTIPEMPAEAEAPRLPLPTGPAVGPEEEASRAAFAAGVERATAMRAPEVNAAIGTAVGQIATERPVDVEPLVQLRQPEPAGFFLEPPARPLRPGEMRPEEPTTARGFFVDLPGEQRPQQPLAFATREEAEAFARSNYRAGAYEIREGAPAPAGSLRPAVRIADRVYIGTTHGEAYDQALREHGGIDPGSTAADRDLYVTAEGKTLSLAEAIEYRRSHAQGIGGPIATAPPPEPPRDPAAIVDQQRDLDRVGVFPGMPQNELAAAAEEARLAAERAPTSRETSPQGDLLKEEQAKAPEDWIATAPGAVPAEQAAGGAAPAEEKMPGLFDDPRVILAEQQAQHLRPEEMEPEERAELDATQRALVEAEDHARALQAAAACRKENEV